MTNKNERQVKQIFYTCVTKPLLIYRLMGLLPIEGLFNPDGKKSRFTLKSIYTNLYGFSLTLHIINLVLIYFCLFHKENTIIRYSPELITTTKCVMVCFSLLHLCRSWTVSVRKIEYLEMLLPPLKSRKILIRRIKWFIGIMVLISLAEQVSYTLYAVLIVTNCFLLEDDSGWYLKSYFLATNSWVFHHIPFSYFFGFVIQINKLQAALTCYMSDILIVVITAYLTCRIRNFYGNLVKQIKRQNEREVDWSGLQTQFTRLSSLASTVNDLISPFVFTSFLFHLLLISKKLFDVLQKKRLGHMFELTECVFNHGYDPVALVYFILSLAGLILRSSMLSLAGAHVHTLSRKPLDALHYVPTSVYNYEMQRLMDQVYHSKIGLNGLQFFVVTRGTILYMISTILTYEFVLLQMK